MKNVFCRVPLWEAAKTLAAVAQGQAPAELVIRNARLVNVCTGEIQYPMDVAAAMGRIAYVGPDAAHCVGKDTRVVDAGGRYLAPGLLDGHVHIESSMMTPVGFAAAVIPHGTVGVYFDPHEICNVLGPKGVELMLEEAGRTPLKAMLTMPSCVPAVPGFEDTGATVDAGDVAKAMTDPRCVALGEMMNDPGVLGGAEEPHAILAETLKADRTITGHYTMPDLDRGLNAYIASGVRSCHESVREEEALAKMRLGMYAMLREGSGWKDLHQVARAVTAHQVDPRFALLVTDDAHPHTLAAEGHVDRLLRRAVEEGIPPVTALQMVTINCAQCFQMDQDLGSVTPGKCADLVLFEDLKDFKAAAVFIDGALAAENGALASPLSPPPCPDWARDTMHLAQPVTAEQLRIAAPVQEGEVKVRTIEVIGGSAANREAVVTLTARHGQVDAAPEQDVLKAAVFERHKATGRRALGFLKGFGITRGAMASTVAHDAHNLLVMGAADADMVLAANTLAGCGGGMCAVLDGRVLGLVPLPVAGLMGEGGVEEMAGLVDRLAGAWKELGCTLPAPFMTMALASLACIPELRLTDRGLVDCRSFTFTPLFL